MKSMWVHLFCVALAPAALAQSIDGSTAEIVAPEVIEHNDTASIEFLVTNGSADEEWICQIHFAFPDCFEVSSGWTDCPEYWDVQFSGVGTSTGHFELGNLLCPFFPGMSCSFFVEVQVPELCSCEMTPIQCTLVGDLYGDHPHMIELVEYIGVNCATPVENLSFSLVKALY